MAYTFTRETKDVPRSSRVDITSVDPELVAALESEWTAHLANPNINHVVDLPASDHKRVVSHASAWGASRKGDKVVVRKLPARNGEPNTRLRISMDKFDPAKPKLGRKPKGFIAPEQATNKPVATAKK